MFPIYKCGIFSMCKAAQRFSLRRTRSYAADGTLRRTQRIGEITIYEWKQRRK